PGCRAATRRPATPSPPPGCSRGEAGGPTLAPQTLTLRQLDRLERGDGRVLRVGQGGLHDDADAGLDHADRGAGAVQFLAADLPRRAGDVFLQVGGGLAGGGNPDGFGAGGEGDEGGESRDSGDTDHGFGSGLRLLPTPFAAFLWAVVVTDAEP